MWVPGAEAPAYLDGSMPGDFGFDIFGLGADPVALNWYRQAELQHARWAMLGVTGIFVQSARIPDTFWYEAALPANLPEGTMNLGALLGVQFLLMHWVEVRRWQDMKNFGCANKDPIFEGFAVPNETMGYPGGVFDPFGMGSLSAEGIAGRRHAELVNGRLAMIAFVGYVIQAQATGEGPIANLNTHVSKPFTNTVFDNLGRCVLNGPANVDGVIIPTPCLWP